MKRVQHYGLRIPFYWMLVIALSFAACKKGDTGPQGEQGETGETGAANVMYSAWKDLSFAYDSTYAIYYAQINEPKVTDSILSMGEIKVYVNLGTPTNKAVSSLPYTEGDVTLTPYFGLGIIEVDAPVNASSYTDSDGNKRLQYRYVIIPGGASLRTGIDWNNYEQVKKELGLPD